jgi:hypothetical protein
MRRREGNRHMKKSLTLPELAGQINRTHNAVLRTGTGALKFQNKARGLFEERREYARQCGQYLIEAKAQLRHGEFMPWLEENVPFLTHRTAVQYMRFARGEITQLSHPSSGTKSDPRVPELRRHDGNRIINFLKKQGEDEWADKNILSDSLGIPSEDVRKAIKRINRDKPGAHLAAFTDGEVKIIKGDKEEAFRYLNHTYLSAAGSIQDLEQWAESFIDEFGSSPKIEEVMNSARRSLRPAARWKRVAAAKGWLKSRRQEKEVM